MSISVLCIADVQKQWNNIRHAFRAGETRIKKYYSLPSGSAARKKKPPVPYKFGPELDFIRPVLAINPTADNLPRPEGDRDSSHEGSPSQVVKLLSN
jgi:hypothetical protein